MNTPENTPSSKPEATKATPLPTTAGLADRIRELMQHYDLSQARLATRLGTYASQINQILKGSNPGYELMAKLLAEFPELRSEWLMRGQGPMLQSQEEAFSESADNKNTTIRSLTSGGQNANPIIITATVTPEGKEIPIYVPQQAHAGYLSGYGSPEYLAQLPAVQTPFFEGHDIRIFEVKGDSMEPNFYDRDIVFCQRVYDIDDVQNGRVYVVVSQTEGIVLKRILRHRGEQRIHLLSDNPLYMPYHLPDEDLLELWYFRRRFTAQVPPPGTLEDRQRLVEQTLK